MLMHKPDATMLDEGAWGDCRYQTWLLAAADGGVVAVTRVSADKESSARPLVFLPGMFSNRHFWVSPKGVGLAAYLARKGHECWLVERRGTGLSPNRQSARKGLEEVVQFDLPAVQAFMAAQGHDSAYWVGHSFGGVTISLSVARYLKPEAVAGLVLFASQFEVDKPMLKWPGRLFVQGVSRLLGRFPARRMGLGPENEPVAAMDDACHWTTQAQKNQVQQQTLSSIYCPVLALVGADDTVDPPEGCERLLGHMSSADKSFQVAGRQQGFADDYNHPGIVVSKTAVQDVWPRVAEWVQARS